MTQPGKKKTHRARGNPTPSSPLESDALTTRPTRLVGVCVCERERERERILCVFGGMGGVMCVCVCVCVCVCDVIPGSMRISVMCAMCGNVR